MLLVLDLPSDDRIEILRGCGGKKESEAPQVEACFKPCRSYTVSICPQDGEAHKHTTPTVHCGLLKPYTSAKLTND